MAGDHRFFPIGLFARLPRSRRFQQASHARDLLPRREEFPGSLVVPSLDGRFLAPRRKNNYRIGLEFRAAGLWEYWGTVAVGLSRRNIVRPREKPQQQGPVAPVTHACQSSF